MWASGGHVPLSALDCNNYPCPSHRKPGHQMKAPLPSKIVLDDMAYHDSQDSRRDDGKMNAAASKQRWHGIHQQQITFVYKADMWWGRHDYKQYQW